MGILSRIDIHRSLATPDTPPPELEGPRTSVYTFRALEDRSWKAAVPISPPMSSYDHSTKPDMSAGKNPEESQANRDALQHAPRPQLPSLSSIFGPPNQIRPLHSPLSDRPLDRPSPLRSPMDRPHSASANSERSYSNSYFPSVSAPATQPRSAYEPRTEQERISLPSVVPRFPGPLSPRNQEFDHTQTRPRNESTASARWSSQSNQPDSRRPEYVFGTREPTTFRPVNDRLPFPPFNLKASHESSSSGYRDQVQMQPVAPSHSPTSAHTTTSEVVPVKDGLGPKIWTGTQFLPRFVRQEEVPGEGLCYFYDDGTHCKTVIDGEQVNAHWGVTKAGKPRKRLAIACMTCREKKVKCDPDFPRCVQCEKFGRVCKFKNAPRGGHNTSPVASPGEHEDRQIASQSRPVELKRQRSASSDSVSPRTTSFSHSSPELSSLTAKRVRSGYENYEAYKPSTSETARSYQQPPEIKRTTLSWHERDLPRIREDILCRSWQTDPYVSDPQATSTLITSSFNYLETTALRFLPAQVVTIWIKNNAHTKSPEDLMLLYSLLAFGVHVSGGSKSLAHEYTQVATFACERSSPGMQLVQSRLVLSLLHLASGREFDSYVSLSGAISTALCLQYNLELDQSDEICPTSFPYDMNRETYAEARRRTLFSCLILERVNGLFPSRPTLLKAEDIFLRLPHDEGVFDDNMEDVSETPMFNGTLDISFLGNAVGVMGCLVYIVEIWGRILTQIQRETLGSDPLEADPRILERISERLQQYDDALPPRFRFTDQNMVSASIYGVDGSLTTLHLVFLLAKVKFSRHGQSAIARSLQAQAIIQKIKSLATDLMYATSTLRDQLLSRRDTGAPFLPATFTMYAAVEAIDVMTEGGSVSSIDSTLHEIARARDLCEALSSTWDSAKIQTRLLDDRADKLLLIREKAADATPGPVPGCEIYRAPNTTGATGLMYRILEPLETRFPLRLDAVYAPRPMA